MELKLIKQEWGYKLMKQGFLLGSTDHVLIEKMNIEEGSIRHKLSIKNCEEIENEFKNSTYNLTELAESNWENINGNFPDGGLNPYAHNIGFKEGFKTALELFIDKKYTIEDISKLMYKVKNGWFDNDFEQHIQSLENKEINVEIKMIPYHNRNFIEDGKTHVKTPFFKPETDGDGCIILIKIKKKRCDELKAVDLDRPL